MPDLVGKSHTDAEEYAAYNKHLYIHCSSVERGNLAMSL